MTVPANLTAIMLAIRKLGHQVQRSLRLRRSASASIVRTFGTSTNPNVWSFSTFVKRGALGVWQGLFTRQGTASGLWFRDDDVLIFIGSASVISTAKFRDPTSNLHVMCTSDGTTIRIYANTVLVASGSATSGINAAGTAHTIGAYLASSEYLDGVISHTHFVDGQQLLPSAFVESDASGNLRPKAYTGTYGANGTAPDFYDPTNLTTLMLDRSGNGNNWTASNISLTAGVTYDSMLDVPLGSGGSERGNYCTWNPLDSVTNKPTNGNLRVGHNAAEATRGSIFQSSGKWYYEFVYDTLGSGSAIGIGKSNASYTQAPGLDAAGYGFNPNTGNKNNAGVSSAYGSACTTGDVIGVAWDLDNGKIWWSKNGVWPASGDPAAGTNPAFTGVAGEFAPMFGISNVGSGAGGSATFGQRPFAYTPPAGFKGPHTGNLPGPAIDNPSEHFKAVLWSGNATVRSIGGVGFEPGLVWGKARNSGTANFRMFDVVRGPTKELYSSATIAEATDANGLTSFNSDGFGLGVGASFNNPGDNYAAWCFKAGGAPVANNLGSVTSQVSVNALAGLSIVTFTGAGATATVGHGQGAVPKVTIVKQRGASGDWFVYHAGASATPQNGALFLNLTPGFTANSGYWNNTAPTASVFTIGAAGGLNAAGIQHVAYCFSEVAGYSKFGSYIGNGSADGTYVYCGFEPALVIGKRVDGTTNWFAVDNARTPNNPGDLWLLPNGVNAEQSQVVCDFTATGFKLRSSLVEFNGGGAQYIFMAFAKTPTKYALAR